MNLEAYVVFQNMLGNWRLVHRGVLVRPEVPESIVRHALLLRVAYHFR